MKFIKNYIALCLICAISACSSKIPVKKFNATVDAAQEIKVFKNVVSGANNSYFVLKTDNYFDFYRELFDSVKNTRYPGTYIMKGDTIQLTFNQKSGKKFLSRQAVISGDKITFFK